MKDSPGLPSVECIDLPSPTAARLNFPKFKDPSGVITNETRAQILSEGGALRFTPVVCFSKGFGVGFTFQDGGDTYSP